MFIEALPAHCALQQLSTLGEFTPATPLHLGRAGHKALTSIGHLTDRFLAASVWQMDKLRAENPWPALAPLLAACPSAANELHSRVALSEEGVFGIALGVQSRAWCLQPAILPDAFTQTVLEAWHRVQPDAPRHLPPLVPVPQLANAPMWSALLHLQPFQSDWEHPLRRNHVHVLNRLLPGAWVMDPSPLPPGAVIPVLEIASWEELALLEGSGRRFVISDAWGSGPVTRLNPGENWQPWVTAALAQAPAQRQILTEIPEAPHGMLFALYHKKATRTDYLGSVAMHAGTEGESWKVSRVAV